MKTSKILKWELQKIHRWKPALGHTKVTAFFRFRLHLPPPNRESVDKNNKDEVPEIRKPKLPLQELNAQPVLLCNADNTIVTEYKKKREGQRQHDCDGAEERGEKDVERTIVTERKREARRTQRADCHGAQEGSKKDAQNTIVTENKKKDSRIPGAQGKICEQTSPKDLMREDTVAERVDVILW